MALVRQYGGPLALALVLAAAAPALAQQSGGPVPPFEPPKPIAEPPRDAAASGEAGIPQQAARRAALEARIAEVVDRFQGLYGRQGRPRLAIYWNRQLSDAFSEWSSDGRVVISDATSGDLAGHLSLPGIGSGDAALRGAGSRQLTLEVQRRNPQPALRISPSEVWEWEFEDGFLAPLMRAGAVIVDRAAILRLTAARQAGPASSIEIAALKDMADILLEVLVTPSPQSRTGYELRVRALEIASGRVVANVNSRSMEGWRRDGPRYVATERGFELEDEDTVGPEPVERYRATASGFVPSRRVPKLRDIAQNLSLNTLHGLSEAWARSPS